ncbi:MAG TPA: dihydroneopterin aldolase [Propionibacteriaceae bacterium]|nr:dihydroneopterin aldolase [Propionibacteriaceae bacterium]
MSLTGISAFGHHGVFDSERQQGQRFVVDVSCTLDLSSAASTDDLGHTIDYGALAQAVAADVERDPLNLIEALADRIALTCLRYDAIQCVEVTVHKPQAPMPVDVADVTVTLTRSKTT